MDLTVKNFQVKYNNLPVVKKVNFTLNTPEIIALIGPSGCGKTTLLKGLSGILPKEYTAGEIFYGKEKYSPEAAPIGLVFQDPVLFPNKSVWENLTYFYTNEIKKNREQFYDKVTELLQKMQVKKLINKYPGELSGGQAQRISLIRTMLADNPILFLDEPFSKLDAHLKQGIMRDYVKLIKEKKYASIFVTHSFAEAELIADKILIMVAGEIVQAGSVREVYRNPISRKTAEIVGYEYFIPLDYLKYLNNFIINAGSLNTNKGFLLALNKHSFVEAKVGLAASLLSIKELSDAYLKEIQVTINGQDFCFSYFSKVENKVGDTIKVMLLGEEICIV